MASNRALETSREEAGRGERRRTHDMVEASAGNSTRKKGAGDSMKPVQMTEVENGPGRDGKRPRGGSGAERSRRVPSGGGNGDGEWSVQTVHIADNKRGSLPKLGRRRGGDGDGDGDGDGGGDGDGEQEEPRGSGKRSRSARQRSNTRTPRKGDSGGAGGDDDGGPPSTRHLGERGREEDRVGSQQGREEAARDAGGGAEKELDISRAHLSPSSISSSASIAARVEVDGRSVGEGRTRPPRLDL